MRSAMVIETNVALGYIVPIRSVLAHRYKPISQWIEYDNHDWSYIALVDPRQGLHSAYSPFSFPSIIRPVGGHACSLGDC